MFSYRHEQIHFQIFFQEISRRKKINFCITKFYIEPGISGTNDNRKQFNLLIRDIKLKSPQFLIFKELSRLSRAIKTYISFIDLCKKYNCLLCETDQIIDLKCPDQYRYWTSKALEAEIESKRTSKRVKENVFYALVYSKKFNSTKPYLGLDPLVRNGKYYPGYYSKNALGIKTVEYIMNSFLKFASFRPTVLDLNKKGILNINGSPFRTDTLKKLLTNLRYIGEWEINKFNKEKENDDLMPYEQYVHIKEFPHGCLINKKIWNKVQNKIKELEHSKKKNTRVKRVNLLQGILKYKDFSNFIGDSSSKNNASKRYYYYRHPKIGKRLPVEIIESKAKNILEHIINKTPILLKALSNQTDASKKNKLLINDIVLNKKNKINELKIEKKQINDALVKLITESKTDFSEVISSINEQLSTINKQIYNIKKEISAISSKKKTQDLNTDLAEVSYNCTKALRGLQT